MFDRIKYSLLAALGGSIGCGLVCVFKGIYRGMDLFWFCAVEFITFFVIHMLITRLEEKRKSKKQ